MTLDHLLRNLHLVERNREWLTAPVSTAVKLGYYTHIVRSYAALLGGQDRKVGYLGRPFFYDNPATPLNLQVYPYEVGVKVLRRMAQRPKTVLDVGANIGQFSRTLAYLAPDAEIDAFEPNSFIYPILRDNAAGTNIRTFNHALGPTPGTARFFYEPNRSGVGSFIKLNAGNQERLQEIEVSICDSASSITGRNAYDLVKIDVEGSELEVLSALRGIQVGYLFLEASGQGRSRSYTDAQLYETIQSTLGDFDVVFSSGLDANSVTYELLLRFTKNEG